MKALIRKSHKDYTYDIPLNAKCNPKKITDIADAFNKQFCSKYHGMYTPLDLDSLLDTPTSHGAPHLCFDLFTVDEVFETLKNLDASKSPRPDEILPVFLKSCSNELAPVLCDLFNFSFPER